LDMTPEAWTEKKKRDRGVVLDGCLKEKMAGCTNGRTGMKKKGEIGVAELWNVSLGRTKKGLRGKKAHTASASKPFEFR